MVGRIRPSCDSPNLDSRRPFPGPRSGTWKDPWPDSRGRITVEFRPVVVRAVDKPLQQIFREFQMIFRVLLYKNMFFKYLYIKFYQIIMCKKRLQKQSSVGPGSRPYLPGGPRVKIRLSCFLNLRGRGATRIDFFLRPGHPVVCHPVRNRLSTPQASFCDEDFQDDPDVADPDGEHGTAFRGCGFRRSVF